MIGALLLVVLAAPSAAFASARVTSQDRAATRAYLEAKYALERSLLANAPASTAAVQALASRLEGECPGVLLGAPHESVTTLLISPPRPRSARRMGEEQRENRQWSELQLEFVLAVERTQSEPNREAVLAYARALRSLRWSSEAVTVLESSEASGAVFDTAAAPDVCADMKSWVASGYKTLAPGTKALGRELEALFRPLARVEPKLRLGRNPLLAYEGAREKVLAAKIGGVERALLSALRGVDALTREMQFRLSLGSRAETEAHEGPPKGSVEIAHGNTAAGASYTVWVEPKKSGSGSRRARCPLGVGVYETETSSGTGVIEAEGGSGPVQACLSRSHPKSPRVQCQYGDLTIEAQTLASARTVRLHLSDGRQIISRVAFVPAKLGGPAGFYYQVVHGPSPIPVSLSELDGHGRMLRTVKLPRTRRCTKPTPFRTSERRIAVGSVPQGPSFSISGERSNINGQNLFHLRVEVAGLVAAGGISGAESAITVGGRPPAKARAFVLQLQTGCQPHEYAILYGVLNAARDTVLARNSSGLRPFRRVGIPASLHTHGVLAYIALPAVPSEVLVRTPKGKTVFTEKLAGKGREARETCEGEAEGPV